MDEKNCFSLRREEIIYPDKPITFKGGKGYETYKIDDFTIGVRPKWIKVKIFTDTEIDDESNIPCEPIIVTNGDWVQYIEEHGWDNGEYYFHDGTGQLEGVTHWMPLPKPPKN